VDPEDLPRVLKEDGYVEFEDPSRMEVGDIVIYEYADGKIAHAGIVNRIDTDFERAERKIEVLSKWGQHGEYFHSINDLPELLGTACRFYTDREL